MKRFPLIADQFLDSYSSIAQILIRSPDQPFYRCFCKILAQFHFSYYKIHKNDKASFLRKAPIDRLIEDYRKKDFCVITPVISTQDVYEYGPGLGLGLGFGGSYPPGTKFRSFTIMTLMNLRKKRAFKGTFSKSGFFYLLESLALINPKDKEEMVHIFSENPGKFIMSVQSDCMESAAHLIANVGGVTFASLELSNLIEIPAISQSVVAPLCICMAEQMQASELNSPQTENIIDRLISKMIKGEPFAIPGTGTLLLKMIGNGSHFSRRWIERLKKEIEGLVSRAYQLLLQYQAMNKMSQLNQLNQLNQINQINQMQIGRDNSAEEIENFQAEIEHFKSVAQKNWKTLALFEEEMEKITKLRMGQLVILPEEAEGFASLLKDEDISGFQMLLSRK